MCCVLKNIRIKYYSCKAHQNRNIPNINACIPHKIVFLTYAHFLFFHLYLLFNNQQMSWFSAN